jgi:hypothetical protein
MTIVWSPDLFASTGRDGIPRDWRRQMTAASRPDRPNPRCSFPGQSPPNALHLANEPRLHPWNWEGIPWGLTRPMMPAAPLTSWYSVLRMVALSRSNLRFFPTERLPSVRWTSEDLPQEVDNRLIGRHFQSSLLRPFRPTRLND